MIRIDGHRTLAAEQNVAAWTTACPGDTYLEWMDDVRAVAQAAARANEQQEDDMTTYKLFHTWGPARLWIIAYVAGVPIYRRWITTQAGAQVLIGELGQPETISEDQLKTVPAL